MNALDCILETDAEVARRIPADHGRQIGMRAGRDPDLQFADPKFLQRFIIPSLEGVAGEILDCAQHPRDHVGILRRSRIRAHVEEREARLAMDEKNLLNPINKTAQHDDLGKAAPGAESLETPLQALPGKTLLQRLIEGLQECAQGLGNRSPDYRADDGMERVDKDARPFFDRFADRALDRRLEGAIVPRCGRR